MTDSSTELMRLDLHNHTRGSFDCLSDPEALLRKALDRGVDRMAITDHNALDVALHMAERHPDRIIPGEEIKTAEGIDVIGLYLQAVIPKGTPAVETCQRIRDQGGIAYLPHPFAGGKGGGGTHVERLVPHIDVIEVFNARLHPGRLNALAEEVASREGLLRVAGSDAHTIGEIAGAGVTVPRHENTAEALLAALAGATVWGETAPWLVHLASTFAKVARPAIARTGRYARE